MRRTLWAGSVAPEQVARRVEGKLVVVTGASSGIGRELAFRLASVGAEVVAVARRADELESLARSARRLSGTIHPLRLDLRELSEAGEAGCAVIDRWGGPELLVCNAGHSIHRYLAEYTERFHDVARTIGVNYSGAVAFALPLLAEMRRAGRGHLIGVSTTSVSLPLPGWSVYTASKAAFEVWLECVAPELAPDGVATTTVHLPRVATAMSAPTAGRYPVPELSIGQAADVLCSAIVSRRRYLTPGWARVVGVVRTAAPGLSQRRLAAVLRAGLRP